MNMCLAPLRRWFGSFHDGAVCGSANHVAATVTAAVIAPKLIKQAVDRTRPDRVVMGDERKGVKESGKPHDSFPSGHSVNIAAVVSALSWAYPQKAWLLRTLGAIAAGTPIAVLAHWSTDVAAGLMIGVALERGARHVLTPESRRAVGRG